MTDVSVIVVVDDGADFDKVKATCASRGLKDVSALPRMRMLKGTTDAASVAALTKVPGVTSVEREREIKLPPRGSPVQ